MKNDGTNFFKYAVAVAVACTKDERPKGDVTPEEAAAYIRSILELIFCYSGIHGKSHDLSQVQQDPYHHPAVWRG